MLPDSYLDALCASQLTSSTNSRPYSPDLNCCISSEWDEKGCLLVVQKAKGRGQRTKAKKNWALLILAITTTGREVEMEPTLMNNRDRVCVCVHISMSVYATEIVAMSGMGARVVILHQV